MLTHLGDAGVYELLSASIMYLLICSTPKVNYTSHGISPLPHSIPTRLNREILVILPNWLGDAVMATPLKLFKIYPDAELTLVGSYVSIEALKYHPQCKRHTVDETKKGESVSQYLPICESVRQHDLAITFRNQLHSSLLLFWSGSAILWGVKAGILLYLLTHAIKPTHPSHLVEQYRDSPKP
jgi:heptosyltransferase-2